jgi:hypothetical protein
MSDDLKEDWADQAEEEAVDDAPFIRNDKKTNSLHRVLDGLFFGPERFDIKKFASAFTFDNRRAVFRFIIQYVIPKFYPSEMLYCQAVRDIDHALFMRVKEVAEYINNHDVSITTVERDWILDKMNYLVSIDRCDVVSMLRARSGKEGARGIQIVPRFEILVHAASKKKSWFKHYNELWGKITTFHSSLIQQAHDIASACGNTFYLKKCHPFFARLKSDRHDENIDRLQTFEWKYSESVRLEYAKYLEKNAAHAKSAGTDSVESDPAVNTVVKATPGPHAKKPVEPAASVRPQQPPGFTNPPVATSGADTFYSHSTQAPRHDQTTGFAPGLFDGGSFSSRSSGFGQFGHSSAFGAPNAGQSASNGIDFNTMAKMFAFFQHMNQFQQTSH